MPDADLRPTTIRPRLRVTVASVISASLTLAALAGGQVARAPVARPAAPTVATVARPWQVRVTATPNPVPAGSCAAIAVQTIDPTGTPRTTLATGQPLDPRLLRYASSDATDFQWQNGNPLTGAVCAVATTTAAKTTIPVALPDGTTGSIALANVPASQSAAASAARPQAALAQPGLALTAVAHQRPPPPPPAGGHTPPPVSTTVSSIALVGTYWVPQTPAINTNAAALVGTYFVPHAIAVTTNAVQLTGLGTYPPPPSGN
jgi:hypothetical protein